MRALLPVLLGLMAGPAVASPTATPADPPAASPSKTVKRTAAPAEARPSLDRATAAQLAGIPGISPMIAERIVALRTARGGHLTSVEELRVIDGISTSALDALRGSVDVELALGQSDKEYTSVDEVLSEFSGEPTVQMVQRWTDEYARTSPEMIKSWNSAARGFAALPRFEVEYYLDNDYGRRFDYVDETVGFDPAYTTDGQDNRIRFRGTWELSELVMSSDRIRIINESQDAVKLREKLLTQVTRLYFDRRRHQVEMLLNPRTSLDGQVEDELRLLELTASIDALTGGEFSRSLRGGG